MQEITLQFLGINSHRTSELATHKNILRSAPVTKSVLTAIMFPCLIQCNLQVHFPPLPPPLLFVVGFCLFFLIFNYLGEMAFYFFFFFFKGRHMPLCVTTNTYISYKYGYGCA